MKMRQGFVSNSSSSSFMIFGATLDKSKFLSKLFKAVDAELLDKEEIESVDDLGNSEWLIGQMLESLELPNDLTMHNPSEEDEVYFGLGIDDMGDDETKKQFQEAVQSKIDKVTEALKMPKVECEWIEHTYSC
jgi:hypothetical protein